MQKQQQKITQPPVHLHVLIQLLDTLMLISVRVTSIQILRSSGLETFETDPTPARQLGNVHNSVNKVGKTRN